MHIEKDKAGSKNTEPSESLIPVKRRAVKRSKSRAMGENLLSAQRRMAGRPFFAWIAAAAKTESGQTTIEAAIVLPVALGLILLLLQPAILLYDRTVMSSAAAEGCRVLATRLEGREDAKYVGFVKRRLAAVPPVDLFHVHEPCSWNVATSGGMGSKTVRVTIENRIRPIPLIGLVWTGGLRPAHDGTFVQTVSVSIPGVRP